MRARFYIFLVRLCPILNVATSTFQTNFFACHLFHDFFDFDANSKKSAAFESMVGVPVDDATLSHAGFSQKKNFYRIVGSRDR